MFSKQHYEKNKILYSCAAGFTAGTIQMSSLYWLKTPIKYQYVYNTGIHETFKILLNNKDKYRIFRGIIPSVLKVSLGKVGEAGFMTYFKPENNQKDILKNTVISSACISLWKVSLMPFDTLGNSYQVNGKDTLEIVKNKIKVNGLKTLYDGTTVYGAITLINCSIWLYIYNNLNLKLDYEMNKDLRNGIIGFSATIISDLVINPLRIVKTYKQSSKEAISYKEICKKVFSSMKISDFYRGIKVKMVFNCFNSSLYIILWKRLEEL